MTAPSTDFSAFARAVRSLAATPDHYYLQHPSIVEKITHNGRTFYSRYERIDQPLSDHVIQHHLNGTRTLALPLTHHGMGSAAIFLYDGEAPEQFVHVFEHVMQTRDVSQYTVYHSDHNSVRLIALYLPRQSVSSLYAYVKKLSTQLEATLARSWKLLPDPSLPEDANIVMLPYIN